jgi:hypothetical protein
MLETIRTTLLPWDAFIQAVVGLIGFLVTLVGFLVVVWQLLDLRRNIQGATHDRLYAHYSDICKLFLEKPYLRPYFYENEAKPISCPADRPSLNDEIDGMSEMILGLIEHAIMQHDNLPPDSWDNCWLHYAKERVEKSQAIREFYQKNKDWYAIGLRNEIEKYQPV